MLCHPWARVDPGTGKLSFDEEPVEYYRVHAERDVPLTLMAEGDADEDGLEHTVHVACSSVLKTAVEVEWGQQRLLQPELLLQCIRDAHVTGLL
jgi:hypothetical protein